MKIEDKHPGQAATPLERLTITGLGDAIASVVDALGREYFRSTGESRAEFLVGGTLGYHTISLENDDGELIKAITFLVQAQTSICDNGGCFTSLLAMLTYTMVRESGGGGSIRWDGRIYRFFVCWLRDHVHVMKGMKYFVAGTVLKDGIDLYSRSQREDGMIWDNVHHRRPEGNSWDDRFQAGNFIQPFENYHAEFRRIPVENDVEYLFVEGLYYAWKATGDDSWMKASLDSAIRALEYSVTDSYRWSTKYQLLKRGYTIDTWDFQNEDDAEVGGDIMCVKPGETRFGVMFGDNTGYIAACNFLAEMLAHDDRNREAAIYRQRALEMKPRLDKLAWNGGFYRHHVREDEQCKIDLGVDESKQISLSNAYSLNRGLEHGQCTAIIESYLGIKNNLPEGSPGEWFTIYPPFGKGFDQQATKWQYMNASVTPIVAGELAHGAFEHGFEAYGVDILERLFSLGQRFGGVFYSCYTGSLPEPPQRTFIPIDISAEANIGFNGRAIPGVAGWTGEGDNDLSEMVTGRQRLADIDFVIPCPAQNDGRGCIGLQTKEGYAERIELGIGRKAASLYLLHTVAQTGPGNVGGTLKILYSDGSSHSIYIVRGVNASGWWQPCVPNKSNTAIAWRGKNAHTSNIGVITWGFNNPHPELTIEKVVMNAAEDGAFWAVMGLTLSEQPVWFPPDPISFGIPNAWGAAAVVYALIEGLAGVVDKGGTYKDVQLSPRWTASEVDDCTVVVTYPVSGGYVAYNYRHEASAKRLHLTATGSGQRCTFHILLPPSSEAISVEIEGTGILFTNSQVEMSSYADFALDSLKPQTMVITYRARLHN